MQITELRNVKKNGENRREVSRCAAVGEVPAQASQKTGGPERPC